MAAASPAVALVSQPVLPARVAAAFARDLGAGLDPPVVRLAVEGRRFPHDVVTGW